MNLVQQFILDAGITSKGYIFGGNFDGKAFPIEAISSERQSVVVAGSVENVDGRELKEANVIFFDIIDETQSICAKAFFRDKDDYLCALDALRTAKRIQVQGDVRFDTYADDLILFARSAKEIPVPSREDISKTKRVELHVHTQMSEMDSVVPTERLIQLASRWGWDAIAITDHGVVQAFPKAMKTVADNHLSIKVIYGIEGCLTSHDYKEPHANPYHDFGKKRGWASQLVPTRFFVPSSVFP